MSTVNFSKIQDVDVYQKYKEHQEKYRKLQIGGVAYLFCFVFLFKYGPPLYKSNTSYTYLQCVHMVSIFSTKVRMDSTQR